MTCPHCTGRGEGLALAGIAIADVVVAPYFDASGGLLAHASARVGAFRIDGFAIRVTTQGRLVLTWPARRDGGGRRHPIVEPLDRTLRLRVEAVILAEYARVRSGAGRGASR